MLSRLWLTTTSKAAAALVLLSLGACQHTPPPAQPSPKVTYSETYDREIKDIMKLADEARWEEAQAKATALYQQDPKNPILTRIQSWAAQHSPQRRAQAVEGEIRKKYAKKLVFKPQPQNPGTEQKGRRVP